MHSAILRIRRLTLSFYVTRPIATGPIMSGPVTQWPTRVDMAGRHVGRHAGL